MISPFGSAAVDRRPSARHPGERGRTTSIETSFILLRLVCNLQRPAPRLFRIIWPSSLLDPSCLPRSIPRPTLPRHLHGSVPTPTGRDSPRRLRLTNRLPRLPTVSRGQATRRPLVLDRSLLPAELSSVTTTLGPTPLRPRSRTRSFPAGIRTLADIATTSRVGIKNNWIDRLSRGRIRLPLL